MNHLMQKKEGEASFPCRDFAIGAFLSLQSDTPLLRIERVTPREVVFHFSDPERCRELVENFITDRVQVSPRRYHDQIRALKALIHSV